MSKSYTTLEIIDQTCPTINVDGETKKVTVMYCGGNPNFKDEEGNYYEIPKGTNVVAIIQEENIKSDNVYVMDTPSRTIKCYLDGELAWKDYRAFYNYYASLPYGKGYKVEEHKVDDFTRELVSTYLPEGFTHKFVRTITIKTIML